MIISNINIPAPIVAPRGAAFFANVAARMLRWFERLGEARARGAMRRVAATRISEAAAVREFAMEWSRRDPRFAADLMAAADRHETGPQAR